jgi:ribonuclease BN (tRNA processing enzyme)
MRLEVIGNGCGRPTGGQPATGYVIHAGGEQVLLDCGPGVATVLSGRPLEALSAIVISHAHYDHCADLLALGHCLLQTRAERPAGFTIPLYLPLGVLAPLQAVARAFPYHEPEQQHMFTEVFSAREYESGETIRVGEISLQAVGGNIHSIPAWSWRISHGGQVLAYSADTAYAPSVVRAARGANLLLCEALRPAWEEAPNPSHMSAEEAGQIAREAGCGALLLTHITRHDPAWKAELIAHAAAHFSGPVQVTEPGALYGVKPFAHLGRLR